VTTEVTLQEAAELLGVHYMTAYRYVRLGMLPAHKVDGVWRVRRSACEALRAAGRDPPARDAPLVGAGRRRAPWAERLEARLMAGDLCGSWNVVEAALAAGAELDEVYLDIIAPAMVSIGRRWEAGEVDVAAEHRASGITLRLVGRLGPRFLRRGRSRGTLVLGAPAGEQHYLPVMLAADLLRSAGWVVADLGADVPAKSFVQAVSEVASLRAVGVSITATRALEAGAEAVRELRARVDHVPILVGGRAVRDREHAVALGADGWAADGRALVAMLDRPAAGGGPGPALVLRTPVR
jgi:excisionase family DNA binding protein